jgi:uncharacterized protein (TIGR02246 family)
MRKGEWPTAKKWAYLVLGVVLVAVLTAGALLTVVKAADTAADAEFRALLDRYAAAWSSMDPNQPAPLYAQDAGLVFYDLAPFAYSGWSEYREGVQKTFFDKMASGKLTHKDDLRVTRRGNVAWTTASLHLSLTFKDGKSEEVDARHTAIWEKRGGKWLIVHEHVSVPMP